MCVNKQVCHEYLDLVLKKANAHFFAPGSWDLAMLPQWLKQDVSQGFLKQITTWTMRFNLDHWVSTAISTTLYGGNRPFNHPDPDAMAKGMYIADWAHLVQYRTYISAGLKRLLVLHKELLRSDFGKRPLVETRMDFHITWTGKGTRTHFFQDCVDDGLYSELEDVRTKVVLIGTTALYHSIFFNTLSTSTEVIWDDSCPYQSFVEWSLEPCANDYAWCGLFPTQYQIVDPNTDELPVRPGEIISGTWTPQGLFED